MSWTTSAHDLAIVLGIASDVATPLDESVFEKRRVAIDAYVGARAIIESDGVRCPLSGTSIAYEELPEQLTINSEFHCPSAPTKLTARYGFYFDVDSQHLGIGRIRYEGQSQEVVFDASFREVTVNVRDKSVAPTNWKNFRNCLWFGAEHILVGYDHVLFLLALVILLPGVWSTFKTVTAFTLAHSFTLALAWFNIVALAPRLVESAIALSIAYVAGENLLRQRASERWVVAGCFGLVHGLGFYGALESLNIHSQNKLFVLFSFNLGVEIGQAFIVLLVYAPLYCFRRRRWFPRMAAAASLSMFVIALWWFFERAIVA